MRKLSSDKKCSKNSLRSLLNAVDQWPVQESCSPISIPSPRPARKPQKSARVFCTFPWKPPVLKDSSFPPFQASLWSARPKPAGYERWKSAYRILQYVNSRPLALLHVEDVRGVERSSRATVHHLVQTSVELGTATKTAVKHHLQGLAAER